MLTCRIDAALRALSDCRNRVPALRDLYRPGSPERAALDDLLDAVGRTDDALRGRGRIGAIGNGTPGVGS